jgi:hypothetical protein
MLLKIKQNTLLAAMAGAFDLFHKYICYFSGLLSILNVVPSNTYVDIFHNMSYANNASAIAAWGGLCYGRFFPPQRAPNP